MELQLAYAFGVVSTLCVIFFSLNILFMRFAMHVMKERDEFEKELRILKNDS